MPGRKHPLPEDVIGAHNSIEENAQLGKHGVVFADNLALAIHELLTHADWQYRQDIARMLGLYLSGIFSRHDESALKRVVSTVELVADHMRRGKPYDRNLMLAAEYVMEVESEGEELTKSGLHAFLDAQSPNRDTFDDSYIYKLLKRLGRPLR
jgi:hypothetical protein